MKRVECFPSGPFTYCTMSTTHPVKPAPLISTIPGPRATNQTQPGTEPNRANPL
jgi:hypothetical protein